MKNEEMAIRPDSIIDQIGRIQIGFAIVYMLIYIPISVYMGFFLNQTSRKPGEEIFYWWMGFHFFGMLMNLTALVLTIRDLYLRPFPGPNDKLTWSLLIIWTGGIGLIVYYIKHVLIPRSRMKTCSVSAFLKCLSGKCKKRISNDCAGISQQD